MATEASALEWALERDRRIVIGGLGVVIAASWAYVLAGAGMDMAAPAPTWTPGYFALVLAMWWVMMVAMMLPSAAPMILLFAALNRKQGGGMDKGAGGAAVPVGFFVAGYGLVWGGFSLLAATLQWGLDGLSLLTPMMAGASVPLGAGLLIAAGVYQLTPLKHACLRHCQAPIQFLGARWRPGVGGALAMGLEHGLVCLGCCWVLMGLLFYGGVMNPLWIGGLALYVLAEKLAPAGHWIGRFGGGALILWGAALLL